jgi:DNA repair exonuclease SbcCD ATPase subunit
MSYEIALAKVESARDEIVRQVASLTEDINNLDYQIQVTKEAVDLAVKCLEDHSKNISYIESIVTTALQAVFGKDYKFFFERVLSKEGVLRGIRAKVRIGDFESELTDSFGAGVQAVASLFLRIAAVLLSGLPRVLIMDEPLVNLSPKVWLKLAPFLEQICENSGLQIIMVTHVDAPIGTVWRVVKNGDKSEVYAEEQEETPKEEY